MDAKVSEKTGLDDAPGRLLGPDEVSQYLHLGRTRTYELMKRGEIPVLRLGRLLRCRQSDIDDWIARKLEESL